MFGNLKKVNFMQEQGKISFVAAVLMSINIIVGAGIFAGPKSMALVTGNASFLGWVIAGILMFPIIWCVAQASTLFPGGSGFYHYCATGINKTGGFIAQWLYLLGYIGTAGTLVSALRNGFVEVGFTSAGYYPIIFNGIVIFFFAFLNLMSISVISRIQSSATLLKMLPLLFVVTTFVFYWNPELLGSMTINFTALTNTIPFAIFGYWGFEACCSLGNFLEEGPESVGKVIFTAFFITMILYMFFHFGIIHIMGAEALASQGGAAFPYFMNLSPLLTRALVISISGSILLSFANSIFGVSLTNITNIYDLARNKMIGGQAMLMRVNSIQRPTFVPFLHALIVFVLLAFISSLKVWFALTNLGICCAFVLLLVALFLTYLKRKNYVHVAITCLGFASCSILIYFNWIGIASDTASRLLYASPLIGGLVLGLLMFKMQQLKQKASL